MFKFGYSNKLVKSKKHLTLEATTTSLYSLLEQIAMKARLRFKRVNNRILVIKEGKKHRKSFGAPVVQMGGIRGIISDEDTGGPIIGVSVGIKGSSKGTATGLILTDTRQTDNRGYHRGLHLSFEKSQDPGTGKKCLQ